MSFREKSLFWLGIILLFFAFLFLVKSILLPFVFGIIVAYFLDPVADTFERWGVSRTGATALITLSFFGIVIAAAFLLLPVLYEQFYAFAKNIPLYVEALKSEYGSSIEAFLEEINVDLTQFEAASTAATDFSAYVLKFGTKIASSVWQSGVAILNVLSLMFISPVIAFYLLRDWDKMVAKIDDWLPRNRANEIREQCKLIDDAIAGWIRGQTNVCILLGIFYAIGLSIVGLDFGLFIGFATGFFVFIPYAGMAFGMLIALSVGFFQFSGEMIPLLSILSVFIAGQVIEGNFITPKLVGDKVGLHPVWLIFGMLVGAALFGFVGILLAVPLTAVIGVLTRYTLAKYLETSLYTGKVTQKRKTKKAT